MITRLFLMAGLLATALMLSGQDSFYAYHTKVSHTSTDYFGKYADLIVVLGEDHQLEFTRRTQYVPRWVTPSGVYMIDEFFPDRDSDPNMDYNYVRLMEESPERIVVHWRYFPDIQSIREANDRLEPTFLGGFTAAVHETFAIYPDGRVEREVRDARDSRYESWNRKGFAHRQEIRLLDEGVKHGSVRWGQRRVAIPEQVEGHPPKTGKDLSEPVLAWTFDDRLEEPEEDWDEWDIEEFAYTTREQVSEEPCEIEGHAAYYNSGVSGTALGFDGYYTAVRFEGDHPDVDADMSVEAWMALDVYPFNEAPLIHCSREFGEEGFYLGVDPYGKLLLRINGSELRSEETLPLYTWKHAVASVSKGIATLFLDGKEVGNMDVQGELLVEGVPITLGINTEKSRPTDYVRGFDQNIPFYVGFQGMLDEVKIYDQALSEKDVQKHYKAFLPDDLDSPLAKAVLPGENGVADKFGASYKTLKFHDLWDRMWRTVDGTDIVVKFDDNPASVVYWRGTNFAANWVADNNRWMADQSSEIFTTHGCSEHMSDKQTRHSYARIIENNDARVIIHWRYPCVDVGYVCIDRMNWTDEYHTIYPDGTGIRKVVYNNSTTEAPGFQDIQFFTNPGETVLDVVPLNAVTVGNIYGETEEMVWKKPNRNPQTDLREATIQYLNIHADWKIYALYPEPGIGTWGSFEQSAYTDDPFAGPWNHWPVSLVPSDGRFAVNTDRVTHFAVGAGNAGEEAIVHYGFTTDRIGSLVNRTRYWQNAPEITGIKGGESLGFDRPEKAYLLRMEDGEILDFSIAASGEHPVVNPALVIKGSPATIPGVKVNSKKLSPGKDLRIGHEQDVNGETQTVVWIRLEESNPLKFSLQW
jgi:hypothetical protein